MKKEEIKVIKKALKSYLKDLNLDIECPYGPYEEYSDKKYKEIKKERDICKKLLKDNIDYRINLIGVPNTWNKIKI